MQQKIKAHDPFDFVFYVQKMSLRVIASAVAAAVVAKLVLNSYALRRYEVIYPFLQADVIDSQYRLQRLSEVHKGAQMPNIVIDIFEMMHTESDRHDRAVEKIDAIQKWFSMHPVQRFMSWPPILMHV